LEESFRRFTGGLSDNEVVIFAIENNGTSKAITDDEFLQIGKISELAKWNSLD